MMNFLNRDVVLEEMRIMAKELSIMYGVDAQVLIKGENEDTLWLGYQFIYNEKYIQLHMPYKKSKMGEIAKNAISWCIEKNNSTTCDTSHRTIGDVMNALRINRVNDVKKV